MGDCKLPLPNGAKKRQIEQFKNDTYRGIQLVCYEVHLLDLDLDGVAECSA
jgi:hypothetical protein